MGNKKCKKTNCCNWRNDNLNYARLIQNGANYIAISSYIWDNPKLKPDAAIREFK